MSERDRATTAAARRMHPTLDFDLAPTIQRPAGGGAYVQALVWVPQPEIDIELGRVNGKEIRHGFGGDRDPGGR